VTGAARGLQLVVRADATAGVGAGHVMRQAALAHAWRRAGGEARVVGEIALDFVRARLAELGIPVGGAEGLAGDILVVDSYDPAVRARAGSEGRAGIRVLVDDLGGAVPSGFDLVWHPAPNAGRELYPGFTGRFLGGAEFVPVRDDLASWRPDGGDLTAVSLGGGRPPGGMAGALRELSRLAPDRPFAITGDWAPRGWRRLPPPRLWAEAARAARLVTAAGTTAWEAAVVGVPVILLQLHHNQRRVYAWGRDAGVPGLSALLLDAELLGRQLAALLDWARPLPPLTAGAGRVAAALADELRRRRAA
jgi:hypothetical protein